MPKRILTIMAMLSLTGFVLATGAFADARMSWPLEGPLEDCSRPSVASPLPLVSVTAWEQAGSGVWTSYTWLACASLPRGERQSFDAHGPGIRPEVGVLPDETYILAFVRGDSLVVRESDNGWAWETVAVSYLGAPTEIVGRIDMWCSSDPYYGQRAWLTLWSGSDEEGGIRFMRRTELGWDPLETIPIGGSGLLDFAFPQVTEYGGPDGPLPRVFYNDMEMEPALMSIVQWSAGGWSTPVAQTGDSVFGGEFDVARTPDGYVFLSTGLQPACPCNFIYFSEWTESGGWLDAQSMTVDMDYFDWPLSPQVAAGPGGRVHAFWFQLGSDDMLEPHTKRLYYQVRDGLGWADRSADLADQQDLGLDDHLSMWIDDVGEAVFAWAQRDTLEGAPQNKLIWNSYYGYCGEDVDGGPPTALRAAAAPNPFNPAVTITATSGHAVVAVEIFDARGRRIASLGPSEDAGIWRAHWDGRDASGREQPSGAYLARVRDASGAATSCKLILSR